MTDTNKQNLFSRIFARPQNVVTDEAPRRVSQHPSMSKSQQSALVTKLYEEIEEAFKDDGRSWKTNPGRQMKHNRRYPLTAAITKAHEDGDTDALRLYEQFPLSRNGHLITFIPVMRKKLKIDSLYGMLKQEHIDADRKLYDLFLRSHVGWDGKIWNKLRSFLIRNLDQADAIIKIVEERKLYDPKAITALLTLGETTPSALMDGLL